MVLGRVADQRPVVAFGLPAISSLGGIAPSGKPLIPEQPTGRSTQTVVPAVCGDSPPSNASEHASTDRPFAARGEGAAVRRHAELATNRSLSPPAIASSSSIRSRLLYCHEHRRATRLIPSGIGSGPYASRWSSSAGDAPRSSLLDQRMASSICRLALTSRLVRISARRRRATKDPSHRCRAGPHGHLGLLHPSPSECAAPHGQLGFRIGLRPWLDRPAAPSGGCD